MNLESCWTSGALWAGDLQVYLKPSSLMPTCPETPFLLAGPPWVRLLDRFSGYQAGLNILPAFYNRASVLGSAPARGWLVAILGPWSFQALNPSAIHRITPEQGLPLVDLKEGTLWNWEGGGRDNFYIESLDCLRQGSLYLLCFLHGGIVFGPPVNDVFSRLICYGPLPPFGGSPGRFPGVLANDEDGLLVRPHGTAWSYWRLTGFLKRKMHSGRRMEVWAGFVVAALCTTSINESLIICSFIHLGNRQAFVEQMWDTVLDFGELDAIPTFGKLTVQEGRLTHDTMWCSG